MKYKAIFVFLFFTSITVFSQTSYLDSLIKIEIPKLRKSGDYEGEIKVSKTLISESKKSNFKDGIAWGYNSMGNALCNLGRYTESLKYLFRAKELAVKSKDLYLKAVIEIEIGRNYNEQSISYDLALLAFKEGERIGAEIRDSYNRESILLYSYGSQASTFTRLGMADSAYLYYLKSFQIEKSVYSASTLIYHHLQVTKNSDSVYYYLSYCTSLIKHSDVNFFDKAVFYNQWGDYFFLIKSYNAAFDNYKKSLAIARTHFLTDEHLYSLKKLAECSELLNQNEASLVYLKEYSRVQDSVTKAFKSEVNSSVQEIVEHQKRASSKSESNLKSILLISIMIFLVASIIFLIVYRKNLSRKSQLVKKSQQLLTEKEEELDVYQRKLNEAFDELVLLASTNHPNFYARFNEVYPELQGKLLQINASLLSSELLLCSYIYLDFQTKEIASAWFKSIRTIQNRKNSLRKKLNLSSSDDFYVWIKSL